MKTIVDEARFEYVIHTVEYNSSISSALFTTRVDVETYMLIIEIVDEDFTLRVYCKTETQSDTSKFMYSVAQYRVKCKALSVMVVSLPGLERADNCQSCHQVLLSISLVSWRHATLTWYIHTVVAAL